MCLLGTFCNRGKPCILLRFITKRDVAYKLKFCIMGHFWELCLPDNKH